MNKFLTVLLTGFIALPSFAGVSANVAFASDYIWRGMTQTGSDPALSGGFDFESESGFYARYLGFKCKFF